jgi:hypothetical protein
VLGVGGAVELGVSGARWPRPRSLRPAIADAGVDGAEEGDGDGASVLLEPGDTVVSRIPDASAGETVSVLECGRGSDSFAALATRSRVPSRPVFT